MSTRIYLPSRAAEDWRDLLADPQGQWRRGYSAMAAALSWQAAEGSLPPEIAALLPPAPELLLALPEHKVALPGGTRPSQCDVFALVRISTETCALAVEAKVNEPFGPTLADWLTPATPGKTQRLASICELLGLDSPPSTIRYQLLHRTAAAVIEAQRFGTDRAAMIVQSFAQDHRWFADFEAFASLFGKAPAGGEARSAPLPCGRALTLGWATGDPQFL